MSRAVSSAANCTNPARDIAGAMEIQSPTPGSTSPKGVACRTVRSSGLSRPNSPCSSRTSLSRLIPLSLEMAKIAFTCGTEAWPLLRRPFPLLPFPFLLPLPFPFPSLKNGRFGAGADGGAPADAVANCCSIERSSKAYIFLSLPATSSSSAASDTQTSSPALTDCEENSIVGTGNLRLSAPSFSSARRSR